MYIGVVDKDPKTDHNFDNHPCGDLRSWNSGLGPSGDLGLEQGYAKGS